MRAWRACLLLLSLSLGSWGESDPIEARLSELRKSAGLWINGTSPDLDLDQDILPKLVLAKAIVRSGLGLPFETLQFREVFVEDPEVKYLAYWVQSPNWGQRIIFLRWEDSPGRWWSRVFPLL